MSQRASNQKQIEMILAGGRSLDQAIDRLCKESKKPIMRFLRQKGAKSGQDEEMFWSAMAVMVSNLQKGTYRGENSLASYLKGIAHNLLRNELRKEQTRQIHEEQAAVIKPEIKNPEMLLLSKEKQERLIRILEKLKSGCKEVLLLWDQGFNMTEIAERMGFESPQVAMNKKYLCMQEARILLQNSSFSI
ncbi:MAG: RNA polymerase sigma factor [Bacteroidia bacterium]